MKMRHSIILAIFVFANGSYATEAPLAYVSSTASARIEDPELCSEKMGFGGNYVTSTSLIEGKCEGAGMSPRMVKTATGNAYLNFSTNPRVESEKDRTELAFTDHKLKFREYHYIGLSLTIPKESSVTEDFFYLLQLWQCSPGSPIGGIRVARGTSNRASFLMRSDTQQKAPYRFDLNADEPYRIVMRYYVDPSGNGSMKVWVNGVNKGTYYGPIGYKANGACDGATIPDYFRVKFGIYKGNEHRKKYEANFDNVRIGSTYQSVND